MAGKRKLFLTHAGELAHRLVRGLFPDAKAAAFIRAYADRQNRKKLVVNPERLRMLETTIGREALLVATVEVQRLLPRRFAGDGKARTSTESELAGRFEAEFLASLERALDWPAADAADESAAFRRDLEIYRRWTQRPASAAGSADAGQSPFADRCAILLDPAMMEQARRAATLFEGEIVRSAARTLANLSRERAAGRAAKKASRRHRPRRVAAKRGKR